MTGSTLLSEPTHTPPAHWTPSSWRARPAGQQPNWNDDDAVDAALDSLRARPPLVFADESARLRRLLADVHAGRAFLLQAGDCAESFDAYNPVSIRERLKLLLQMAVVLTYSAGVPVVKVARIAGQFAKPRSSDTETVDGVTHPSFRGHIVNDIAFDAAARVADPSRMVRAYEISAGTLNLLRAFTKGGFADLNSVHGWTQEFVADSPAGERYARLADDIDRAIKFMGACGLDPANVPTLHETSVFTSHEALLLGYEEAMTRPAGEEWHCGSAHTVWIGERTREVDGAHVEFFSGISNPIGCKLGPSATPDQAIELAERLNPRRVPGRLTFIVRAGAGSVADVLPPLLRAVTDAGHPVVWSCDPMHGNTFTSESGRKTRDFDAILGEIEGFFAAHASEGTWPGGVHVELTSDDVTECLGGGEALADAELPLRYETMCDPRLNGRQSLDLAFEVAELLGATDPAESRSPATSR